MANVNKAKDVKKKGRKLKRSIRKTLGTLFLVSALVVAAIPVDYLQATNADNGIMTLAAERDTKYSQTPECTVPDIPDGVEEYTVGENIKLKFVYFNDSKDGWITVVTKYQGGSGGDVDIPSSVSAYKLYNPNIPDSFAAVGRSGNFLFYREQREIPHTITVTEYQNLKQTGRWSGLTTAPNKYIEFGSERAIYNEDNEIISYEIGLVEEIGAFIPCQLDKRDDWENLSDSRIYYYVPDPKAAPTELGEEHINDFSVVGERQDYQQIKGKPINYISNQKKDDTSGKWVDITKPEEGVFAEASNITGTSFGKEFYGIGNYAFYKTGIGSVDFFDGLRSIGEGAFQNCIHLQKVTFNSNCPLTKICASAFEGCEALSTVNLPWSVDTIGNAAFKDCISLGSIDLCNEDGSGFNFLVNMGFDVFAGCIGLTSLTFPKQFEQPVYMSTFAGCSALQYICARNKNMIFPEDSLLTYESFKRMMDNSETIKGGFYFQGLSDSKLRDECKKNCFAFSHIWSMEGDHHFEEKNLYELTMKDEKEGGTNTFQVIPPAQAGELIKLSNYEYEAPVSTLEIPKKIGPYEIQAIGEGAFKDFCNLETVIIKDNIQEIGAEAFQGCHNLTNVIFDYQDKDVKIGTAAFLTQQCSSHKCSSGKVETNSADNSPVKQLSFTGPISTDFGAYRYAMNMDGDNRYSNGEQVESYITYYSGVPGNLEIRYNKETELRELVNFPSLEELADYVSTRDRYFELNDENKAYAEAMKTAYDTYTQDRGSITETQRRVINKVLDLEVPEGVQAIKDGLIWEKSQGRYPTKTVTAETLVKIVGGEEYTDANGFRKIQEGTGTFAGCSNLETVTLSPTVTDIGKCPFYGCEKLNSVDFRNSPNFTCDNFIIYGLNDGSKNKIIECLEARTSSYIEREELPSSIETLEESAFRGSNVTNVDLGGTSIKTVPVRAFAETESLNRVTLPESLEGIAFQDYAFEDSTVEYFQVESSHTMRSTNEAFRGLMKKNGAVISKRPESENSAVNWRSPVGSNAEDIGVLWGFNPLPYTGTVNYYVTFKYWDNELQDYVTKEADEQVPDYNVDAAVEKLYPEEAETVAIMEGVKYRLTGWKENKEAATADHLYYEADYKVLRWIVTFQNWNGTPITTLNGEPTTWEVPDEGGVTEEKQPKPGIDFEEPQGRTFQGWITQGNLSCITSDLIAVANYNTAGEYLVQYLGRKGSIESPYEVFDEYTIKEGQKAPDLPLPSEFMIDGYVFAGWDKPLENIKEPTKLYAQYEPGSTNQTPGPGGDQSPSPGPGTQTPTPSPTRRPGGDEPNPDGSYSLDVTGGSGSGSYLPGQQVTITANEAPVGKRFVRWEVSPASVVIADKTKPVTIITMPSSDVAVIPVYVSDLTDVPRPEGTYPCEVQNGDGSGYYAPGSQVIITAEEAPAGKRFVGWNVTPSTVVIADKNSPTTSITMPEGNVTVIPVYVSEGSYSLEVQSGSGSGYHIPGSQIVITADVPPEGKRFVRWEVSPASALLSDKTNQVAILTMPSADVAIIAIYESITGDDNNSSKYNLQVVNGTGSGSYAAGSQVVITADAAPERQRFSRWGVLPGDTVVLDLERESTILTMPSEDVTIMAQYEGSSGGGSGDDGEETYELKVLNGSGSGLYPEGAQVIITANAPGEKQEFAGWDVSPAETLLADKTRMSTIVTMPAGDVGVVANYNTLEPDPTPTPGPTSTPAPALHSLIVHNGSGSGSYVAGAQVVIVANDPAAGQEFTGWTVSPDNTVISDKTLSGAVITMPDNDVAVIANYRTRATGSGNTGSSNTTNTNNSGNNTNNNNSNNNNTNSGSSSNTTTNRPSGNTGTSTGTSNRGGTTVVIDKNGLSNTGVVSATVNGSSDNFTIKITESSEATSAVLNALLAEYGNVDNIKYFPMDISLYDSTGNTKITDTTGLSVSITLPLPDSLITYAGNNKVAGVVNDRLDKLTPRFTTINGVSCVTFTAEHFSPYVIYVDVANLSSGTVTDATPTTGDGIHPKWFLSIGLACMSFVMFMMKDGGKASGKKRKVTVRA